MNPTIEEIKWLCDKAEGFELEERNKITNESAVVLNGLVYTIKDFEDEFKKNIWPLLLRLAVEGVEDHDQYEIQVERITGSFLWFIYHSNVPVKEGREDTRNDAILASLMYIKGKEEK